MAQAQQCERLSAALYIDLLEAEIYNELLVNPQRLEKMTGNAGPQWIIIDEIQRIPALLHEVHRLIEAKKYLFILWPKPSTSMAETDTIRRAISKSSPFRTHW